MYLIVSTLQGRSSCCIHCHNMVRFCQAFTKNMLSLCCHSFSFSFGNLLCNFKSNCYHGNVGVLFLLYLKCTVKSRCRARTQGDLKFVEMIQTLPAPDMQGQSLPILITNNKTSFL